ncbi:glycosyltransferase [Mobilicoccus massiliensis]|uniref:glycosyltransferase n=1 Tax=Mobilicoccus massiliensis TaxID=1522310 RepID=UPI00058E8D32|nr:glycosyltransferase [Mobilicoccus massiliensis]
MKVAVKYGFIDHETLVDADGRILGQDAGATLVRRLLKIFPGAALIGHDARRCDGFDMVPLEFVDAADTVVINMDVLDSVAVWQTLHSRGDEPMLMNFAWRNPSMYHHPVNFAALGLSFALFPTFCNSERTAGEVREVVQRWALPHLAEQAKIAWVNLGVATFRVQERKEPETPVVLYPAIYLDARKNPGQFIDVVERVRKHTPLRVEARLHQRDLVSEGAMSLSTRPWAWVGPLTATKEGYWKALSSSTAFLATAVEESYGLEYIEALLAGVIGVLPDRPWARALLPERYPFFYTDAHEAEKLLMRALTDTAACRAEMESCVEGGLDAWIRRTHHDDDFARAIAHAVDNWFGG